MADLEKILRLVEEGALSAEEAEQVLAALHDEPPAGPQPTGSDRPRERDRARHLRVEVTERGRQVVNLRVPINVASLAAGIVPGLPDEEAERIRSSIRDGERGTILDIAGEHGDRVRIVSE